MSLRAGDLKAAMTTLVVWDQCGQEPVQLYAATDKAERLALKEVEAQRAMVLRRGGGSDSSDPPGDEECRATQDTLNPDGIRSPLGFGVVPPGSCTHRGGGRIARFYFPFFTGPAAAAC